MFGRDEGRCAMTKHTPGPRDVEAGSVFRLIAAAPALLEACRMLLEADDRASEGQGAFGLYVDAVDLARAAIAKAEGGGG